MSRNLAMFAFAAMLLMAGSANARTIHFSGMEWQVKNGVGGPNPNNITQNYWSDSPESIWVDDEGRLHLKIRYEDGVWKCAEVQSIETVKYGEYTWEISNPINDFDPNLVLGLFLYSDQHDHEYDIEFSQWGEDEQNSKNAFYSAWGPGMDTPVKQSFHVNLSGDYTSHIIKWYEGGISFASYHGHATDDLIDSWQPEYYPKATPDDNMRIHMNLWLDGERHPYAPDVSDIEIIINKITVENN
jgi:hypothetical protein